MVKMTNPRGDRKARKTVLSNQEINAMIVKAETLSCKYFRLRAKALVAIFRRTGKRRREVATLEMDDIHTTEKTVSLTFTVVKKRKTKVMSNRREKQIPLSNPLVKHIIVYWEWMKKHYPNSKYFFPSTRSIFGANLFFYLDKHISGRQVLRIIQELNPKAWCHLFRETMGAEVARKDPTLTGVFKVKMRLDLEDEATAWTYMRRYAADVIENEEME